MIAAAAFMAVIHSVRDRVLPHVSDGWILVLDRALYVSEIFLFLTMLLPKGILLLTDLTVLLGVSWHRIRHAWQTGNDLRGREHPSTGAKP